MRSIFRLGMGALLAVTLTGELPGCGGSVVVTTINPVGTIVRQLTNGNYNEHPYFNNDGAKIVRMSDNSNANGGTDWWMMNADGSNPFRITNMNNPGDPSYTGKAVYCGDSTWSPDGSFFIGSVETDAFWSRGKIVKVSLN